MSKREEGFMPIRLVDMSVGNVVAWGACKKNRPFEYISVCFLSGWSPRCSICGRKGVCL